jgi:hypothetical protein
MNVHRFRVSALAVAVTAACVMAGIATAGGPTPGVQMGWDGVTSANRDFRFVAVTSARDTVVQKIATKGGRVTRHASLTGLFGVPIVAWDGTTSGLTRDGRSLVLSTMPGAGSTSMVVVDTRTLKVRQRVSLKGMWSLDALSADARTLFLIQYLPGSNFANYRVRAYDLRAAKLFSGAIVDKREPEAMTGIPMTRLASSDWQWAYTLYSRAEGAPFIHALDTKNRAAVCIDLPWNVSPDALQNVRMKLREGQLLVTQRTTGLLATVDLTSFKVHSLRTPV